MALEAADYVQDLVATNPVSGDPKSQGDDHLRLLKAALKTTFPTADREFRFPSTESATSGDLTVEASDAGRMLPVSALAAARTVTLPAGSGLYDGWECKIIKADHSNFKVTVDGNGSETINGTLTIELYQRYQVVTLRWSTALSAWLADVQAIDPIGSFKWYGANSSPPFGWLFPNGRTIGNASSGGTARGHEDCRGLFYHLWTNFDNTRCAVSGGRGASNQADFDANKTIALPNLAGRTLVAMDTLGGISDAGVLAAANTLGLQGGEELHELTEAELPEITPAGTISIDPNPHSHSYTRANNTGLAANGGQTMASEAGATSGSTSLTAEFTGTPFGDGDPHNNMPPYALEGLLIKL